MIFDENVIRKPRVGIEHFFVRWDMASDWRDIVIQSVYGGDDFPPPFSKVYIVKPIWSLTVHIYVYSMSSYKSTTKFNTPGNNEDGNGYEQETGVL